MRWADEAAAEEAARGYTVGVTGRSQLALESYSDGTARKGGSPFQQQVREARRRDMDQLRVLRANEAAGVLNKN